MTEGTRVGLRLAAPAKLNLSLRVVGRRSDGFHELDSLIVLLELADELVLRPGAGQFRVEGDPEGPVPARPTENLAWRGFVAGLGGGEIDASLALSKRVPVMAGLGGGSSDAAAGWRLSRRWRERSERARPDDLVDLAAIGADVPFFAAQLPVARVTGIGERVEPAELPPATPFEVILVTPAFRLSTAAVFAELRANDGRGRASLGDVGSGEPSSNDLLAPARRLRPELDEILRHVLASGVEPHLTGSGPVLFALEADADRADAVAARLRRAGLSTLRTRLRVEPSSIETVPAVSEESR